MNTVPLYDALASDYDRFVNWEGRLAHELPFLDRLLTEQGAVRVLDTACGTGHHALALAQRGYQVVGVDLSEAMIEQARINASRAGLPVEFAVAGFGELALLDRPLMRCCAWATRCLTCSQTKISNGLCGISLPCSGRAACSSPRAEISILCMLKTSDLCRLNPTRTGIGSGFFCGSTI